MPRFILILLLTFHIQTASAQLYFPPNSSTSWDTISPATLGWCQNNIDSLYQFLDGKNTKAFILLKDGKIVLEKYFGTHTQSSNWYWASAGKTLTAMLVGIAQQENYLHLSDTTSSYLGNGWTSLTPQQEQSITIRDQLAMISGLEDNVPDPHCTLSSCLVYNTDPGLRWAYHNAPYTLLDSVLFMATGQTLNAYLNQKIKTPIGMDGLYLPQGYNRVYFSTARSMARYGLLLLNKGIWNGIPVLSDTTYFHDMTNSSQTLNPSYGYLTWLNGKSSYMIPQSQISFNGMLNPNAPADMFAAMGKNAQFIDVLPSQNMVWIRMGEAPDSTQVPFLLNDAIWEHLNALPCNPSGLSSMETNKPLLYPNPGKEELHVVLPSSFSSSSSEIQMFDLIGQKQIELKSTASKIRISTAHLHEGIYVLHIRNQLNHFILTWRKQ